MNEEQIKQMAEKELVAYLKGCAFSLCPTSKKYMAEHIEDILKQAEATKELQEEINACKFAMAMSEKVEKQLREQIEKMKCCFNCYRFDTCSLQRPCRNYGDWKLKEQQK